MDLMPEYWPKTVAYFRENRAKIEQWIEKDGHENPVEVAFNRAVLANDYITAAKIYCERDYLKLKRQPKKTYAEAARLVSILRSLKSLNAIQKKFKNDPIR